MSFSNIVTGQNIRWGIALCIAVMLTTASLTTAAPDPRCLQDSIRKRSDDVKAAYNTYTNDLNRAADILTDEETKAIDQSDASIGQTGRYQAQMKYQTSVSEATRTLQVRLQQATTDYINKQAGCGYASAAVRQYVQPMHGAYQYGNPYPYNYGYSGYTPDYQRYPRYLQYNVYGYPASYPYGGYGSYNYGGYGYCPQVVMTTLPSGCGYECRRESNGCQTCEVSCRNIDAANRPNCLCPQTYAPVCGRDGRTYTNSCYALCADTGIVYGGGCQ